MVWVSAVLVLTPCCITEEKVDTEVEHKDKFDTESILSERSYEGEILHSGLTYTHTCIPSVDLLFSFFVL